MTFDRYIPERISQPQKHSAQFGTRELLTQKNNTADRSKESENQFRTLIEGTSALIFVIQRDRICYVNSIVELTTGYSRSQLLNSKDFYHQLNAQGYSPENLERDRTDELKIKLTGDRECYFHCCWQAIEWHGLPGIMITATDITKYKQAAVRNYQALMAEKELGKNKTKFVSMVSHEFRTPLNVISFSTSLLKRHLYKWTQAKQLKYLDRLQSSVEQLSSLMDEVLLIGKAEAGKLEYDPRPLNLNVFCQQLLTELHLSQSCCRKINFVNRLEQETILADRNLLKLVLVNILGNAIKYSSAEDEIEFIIFDKCDRPIFQIKDRGIGIPVEEQSKIFEPFHRSNNVGDISGNGLGLAIAKKLVELQHGLITLSSEVGVGSVFEIEIPLKLPAS